MKLGQIDDLLRQLHEAKHPPEGKAAKLWQAYDHERSRAYAVHDKLGRAVASWAARLVRQGLRRAKVVASVETQGKGWLSRYEDGKVVDGVWRARERYLPHVCLRIYLRHDDSGRVQVEASCTAQTAADIAAWAALTAERIVAWSTAGTGSRR